MGRGAPTAKATFVPIRLHENQHDVVTILDVCMDMIFRIDESNRDVHPIFVPTTPLCRALNNIIQTASVSGTYRHHQDDYKKYEDNVHRLRKLTGGKRLEFYERNLTGLSPTFAVSICSRVTRQVIEKHWPRPFRGGDVFQCPGCKHRDRPSVVVSLIQSFFRHGNDMFPQWYFPINVSGFCTNPKCTTRWLNVSIVSSKLLGGEYRRTVLSSWVSIFPLQDSLVVLPQTISLTAPPPGPKDKNKNKNALGLPRATPSATSQARPDSGDAKVLHQEWAQIGALTYNPAPKPIKSFLVAPRFGLGTKLRDVHDDLKAWVEVQRASLGPRCRGLGGHVKGYLSHPSLKPVPCDRRKVVQKVEIGNESGGANKA